MFLFRKLITYDQIYNHEYYPQRILGKALFMKVDPGMKSKVVFLKLNQPGN